MSRIPFYPFLLGLLSLVGIYVANMNDSTPRELLMPVAVLWLATLVLFAIASVITRNKHRAAAIVASILFCFMTYRYWVDSLWSIHPKPSLRVFYGWAVLGTEAVALAILGFRVIWQTPKPQTWTLNLNRLSCVLLLCPILVGITNKLHASPAARIVAEQAPPPVLIEHPDPKLDRPDIYFFVLDAHGRSDVLREQYGYDNSAFIEHLKSKGFYVADESTSNYMWTVMSLAATLNLRYVDELDGPDPAKLQQVTALLHNSALVAQLKRLGYKTVSFESGEKWLCFDEFDSYERISNQIGLTPLQQLIVDTSALSQLGGNRIKSKFGLDRFHAKREMFQYKLAEVPAAVTIPGPKFVLVHFFEPHTPFVFAADGSDPAKRGYGSMLDGLNEEINNEQYHAWYREQVTYTDECIGQMIDRVLALSRKPPVIVLMGDHGPRSGVKADPSQVDLEECMSNLTAIHLPGKSDVGLYPQITPVNIFRVVLNECFDAKLPLLEDHSYYSYPTQFASYDVTQNVKPSVQVAPPVQQ